MLTILREAAQRAGGMTALAQGIGLSRSALYQWRSKVPAERVVAIENLTGISRSRLRPDLFGGEAPVRRRKKRHIK